MSNIMFRIDQRSLHCDCRKFVDRNYVCSYGGQIARADDKGKATAAETMAR